MMGYVDTPKSYMPVIGGIILVLVVVYSVFQGIDNLGLTSMKASAVVVKKNVQAAGTTYTTQIINKRPQAVPQATAETYLLQLDIDGERAEALVSKEIFEAVNVSQTVEATYERRRLTGTLIIIGVTQ